MNLRDWKNWAFILSIFSCIQFIILTIIAMFYYQGGTYINPLTQGYLFWYNYFSDLGRIIAHSGNYNIISFILFTITLSLWGLFQIPFYIAFASIFKNSKKMKLISMIGTLFGIFAGIFFVGIAFAPADILTFWHNLFVLLGSGSLFIAIGLYTILLFLNKNYPKFYAIIFAITSTFLILYNLVLLLTPFNNISTKLFINVIGQKIMIYSLLICEIIQGYGALKQLHS
ncbi:MAG: hypothetical protein ACFFDF_03675 [Candidatus Odinarchaeota archaeon]